MKRYSSLGSLAVASHTYGLPVVCLPSNSKSHSVEIQ